MTSVDWVSMTTGASRPATIVSRITLASRRIVPPQPRRSGPRSSTAKVPSSLGISRSAIVPMNTHIARTGSITGHCGKSDLPAGK